MQKAKFSIDSILSAKISDNFDKDLSNKRYQYSLLTEKASPITESGNIIDPYFGKYGGAEHDQCFCAMCKRFDDYKYQPIKNDDKILKKLRHCNDTYNVGKRRRTIFSAEQLERLEYEFQQQQYLVGDERKYLARELQLNEVQIKVWYQNRRIKWRKFIKPYYEAPTFSRNNEIITNTSL